MLDLKNMSSWEAVTAAVEASGMSNREIGKVLGISPGHVRRYKARGDSYAPSMQMLPALCNALGNRILLDWMEEQCARPAQTYLPPSCRAEILTGVARIGSAVGQLNQIAANTEMTGIRPQDASDLRGAALEIIAECRELNGKLQPLAQMRFERDYPVLASLKAEPERRPWWKFWHGRGAVA